MPRNIEIKAHVSVIEDVHSLAQELSGSEGTIIEQTDTFFQVLKGRLKLREITVDKPIGELSGDLKDLLSEALGVAGKVVKKRTLYLIGQTRIHVDEVESLGNFMEFEVVLREDQKPEEGEAIARDLMKKFKIQEKDLIDRAYVDLLDH
ncbi:hypothetical protein Avbf_01500 [Armadillidium vulgare]|nr:hypothetical protein Avbf_01500 [Armadillidium vulgare]